MRRYALFASFSVALFLTVRFHLLRAGSALEGKPGAARSAIPQTPQGGEDIRGAGSAQAKMHKDRPTLFCYTFADPFSKTLPLLVASLELACDEHTIFTTTEAAKQLEERAPWSNLHVVSLWTKAEFQRSWGFNLILPMQRVWRYVLAKKKDFDWVVKLDDDSWIRPATFRELFGLNGTEYPRRDATVVSFGTATLVHGMGNRILRAPVAARAGEQVLWYGYAQEGTLASKRRAPVKAAEWLPFFRAYDMEIVGLGSLTDGPFIAVSQAAARALAKKVLAGDMCAAELLSGHNCPPMTPGAGSCGGGPKEAGSCQHGGHNYANQAGILRFVFPLDGRGYSMLANGEKPTPSLLRRFSNADPPDPWCNPKRQLWGKDERTFAELRDMHKFCQAMEKTCANQKVERPKSEQSDWVLTKQGLKTPGCNERDWEACAVMLTDGPFTGLSTPRGRSCLSNRLAVVHGVKDEDVWRQYDKAIREETRAFEANETRRQQLLPYY